jgi:hypothetical protein
LSDWRPADGESRENEGPVSLYGGVGLKR